MELTATVGDYINVFASIIIMPCVAITFVMWICHDIGMAMKNKDNWCMKVYKALSKIHIPIGTIACVLGIYHTIFATIKHGWQGITLGNVTFLLPAPQEDRRNLAAAAQSLLRRSYCNNAASLRPIHQIYFYVYSAVASDRKLPVLNNKELARGYYTDKVKSTSSLDDVLCFSKLVCCPAITGLR